MPADLPAVAWQLLPPVRSAAGWVLQTGLEAALIAGLVLLAQHLLRDRVSARWRHNLWLLVVARLVLPALPGSAYSPFNLLPRVPAVAGEARPPGPASGTPAVRTGTPARTASVLLVPAPDVRPADVVPTQGFHGSATAAAEPLGPAGPAGPFPAFVPQPITPEERATFTRITPRGAEGRDVPNVSHPIVARVSRPCSGRTMPVPARTCQACR